VRNDPAIKDAVAVLIEAQELEETVRINVTARESQITGPSIA
jgi:hypothetical protein